MESKIPLPTDNIYKFYALFGLLLFITGIASLVYTQKTTNALLFDAIVTYEELDKKEHPSAVEVKKKELLQRQMEIAVADKDLFTKALGGLIGIAICLMSVGFWRWHTVVQPKQDELLDLQIQKAKHDLQESQRSPFRKVR